MRSFTRASSGTLSRSAEPVRRAAASRPKAATPEPVMHPNFRLADIPLFRMSPPPVPAAGAPSMPIVQRQDETPDATTPRAGACGAEAARLSAVPPGRDTRPADPSAATRCPNRTGLPEHLKANVEAMSGLSLDDVRVHRNSPKPARLQALAYARGAEIHLGPGQERHLPHEAWHVVQQKQGRVRPTLRMNDVAINSDKQLESEAERRGKVAKRSAAFLPSLPSRESRLNRTPSSTSGTIQRQGKDGDEKKKPFVDAEATHFAPIRSSIKKDQPDLAEMSGAMKKRRDVAFADPNLDYKDKVHFGQFLDSQVQMEMGKSGGITSGQATRAPAASTYPFFKTIFNKEQRPETPRQWGWALGAFANGAAGQMLHGSAPGNQFNGDDFFRWKKEDWFSKKK